MYPFSCPYYLSKGYSKWFRSQSGRTYHVRSTHSDNHNIVHNGTDNGPQAEREDNLAAAVPPSAPASPTQAATVTVNAILQRNIHPHINGIF